MKQQKIRSSWRQRTASLMVMILMAGSLFSDMPLVYAAEGVPETEEQVSASEIEKQINALETGEQVSTPETEGQAGVPEDRSYTGDGYEVEAVVTTYWEGGYNLCVTVRNTSEETIHNWGILFETQDSIKDLYNAEILSGREGIYLLRNKVYNQDIPVGGSVSFGYTAYHTGAADVPEEYAVSSIEKAVESDSFTVSCLVSDEWESGAVVQLMIENTSEKTIEELWNADLVSYEAGHYVLRNVSYAQNIPAGEMAVVGMRLSAASGIGGEALENVTVRQIVPSGESGSTPSDNQVSDNNVSDNDISGNEIPEGIINHLSTGGEGGEIYYKTAYASDVVTAPDGLPCIRNQFLLSADETVNFAEVEAYLAQNGARIVGYIEVTNDYQVEMYLETDMADLQELTERIGVQAWVRDIGLNYLWLEEACFQPSDPWTGSSDEEVILEESTLNTSTPSGNNWGLELINFEGALINAGVIKNSQSLSTDVCIDHLTTVKMGIIDSSFDVWHKDLDDNFVVAISNCEKPADLWGNSLLSHGTHVAGIMCAEFNNGIGMNGICIKNELYGAALNGVTHSTDGAKKKCDTTFSVMCGLGFLIQQNVKVINYSSGVSDGMAYSASMDPENSIVIQYLNNGASRMDCFLLKYLKEGYDFLIVTSAGNGNGYEYYEINDGFREGYGCEYIVSSDIAGWEMTWGVVNPDLQTPQGAVDAKYASIINYISATSLCYDHILCVGALQLNEDGSVGVAPYSNAGSRINIYAPGSNIYSTYVTGAKCIVSQHNDCGTGYGHMDGTSMAAPHVSGVAGLAYNINSDISAADLKQIIINTAQNIDGVPVLNAADVIEAVVQYKESDETEEYTIQLHVTDANGNGVRDAAVEVRSRSQYWCKVLGAAMTSNAVGGTVVYSGKTDTAGNIKLDIPQGNYYVLVDGEYSGVLEEIYVSSEDIINKPVKEITMPDYLPEVTRGLILQLGSSTAGENVSSYGFIKNADIRFIKGWIDVDGKEDILLEDYVREEEVTADGGEEVAVYHTNETLGDIRAQLPEGIYTVEVTLPDAEPKYYHIIISDKYDFTFYRFDM